MYSPRPGITSTLMVLLIGLMLLALTGCDERQRADPGDQPNTDESPTPTPIQAGADTDDEARDRNCNHSRNDDQKEKPMEKENRVDEGLLEQAEREGTVSVIVTLDIPYSPEAELDDQEEIDEQRARIAAAQDKLLASLEGHEVSETTRYELFPQIALTVDSDALLELGRSPLVESVDENVLDAPSG